MTNKGVQALHGGVLGAEPLEGFCWETMRQP